MVTPALFGLPVLPPADFNRLAPLIGNDTPTWKDDGDKQIEPEEISSPAATFTTVENGKRVFTPALEPFYRRMAEVYRQERITHELSLTYTEPVHTNFDAWLREVPATVGLTAEERALYKEGMAALLAVAPFMERAYHEGIGYIDAMRTEGRTAADAELLTRYGHPWCVGDQSESCVALPSLAARTSGVIAAGITCEELQAQPTTLGSPFTAVIRNRKGKLTPVPYAKHFATTQQPATAALRRAAAIFVQIPREHALAAYLVATAKAFESTKPFPFLASDEAWRQHGASDSLLYVRVGPDETGSPGVGDQCGLKAHHHVRIGVKNFAMEKAGEPYRSYVQDWEDRYAQLIGNERWYRPQTVVVKMPGFWDVIFENGDAMGDANGNVTGQTLPNWCGADGLQEPCARRTMVFANKDARAYGTKIMSDYILPLFDPAHRRAFKHEIGSVMVLLHELAHNFGPQQGKPRPGSTTPFNVPLQRWAGTMEEFKAQNGALDAAAQLYLEARRAVESKAMTQENFAEREAWYRTVVLRSMAWAVRMVLRATRNGKFEGTAYSRLAAVQIGVLTEEGGLKWNAKGQYWQVDFEKMPAATTALTQRVLRLYAEGDYAKVDAFFGYYLNSDSPGFALLHVDRIQAVASTMPSAVFDFKVSGQ